MKNIYLLINKSERFDLLEMWVLWYWLLQNSIHPVFVQIFLNLRLAKASLSSLEQKEIDSL